MHVSSRKLPQPFAALWSALASPLAYLLIRLALAALFLVAGGLKLADVGAFAATIKAFAILPSDFVRPAALAIPLLEVIAALGLLFDVRGCLAVIAGLLLVFIGVLLYAVHLGLDVDCGCYGPGDPEGEAFHSIRTSLFRDLAMLAGVVQLYVYRLFRAPRLVRLGRLATAIIRNQRKEDMECA